MEDFIKDIFSPSEYELRRICFIDSLEIKPRDKSINFFDSAQAALDFAEKLCVNTFSELTASDKISLKKTEIQPTEFGYDIQFSKNKQKIISFVVSERFFEQI